MPELLYVGVKGAVTSGDRVLLLKREDEHGGAFWDMPGGRINGHESVEEALVREIREEIPSIKDFSIGDLLYAYRLERNLKDGHGLVLLFYEIQVGTLSVTLSNEHSGYRWFTPEALDTIDDTEAHINSGNLEAAKWSLLH